MNYRFTLLLILLCPVVCFSQATVPSIETQNDTLTVYIEGKKDIFPHHIHSGTIDYSLVVKTPDTISLVSETDSISFIVHPKDFMIFDVVRTKGQDTLHCSFNIVEKHEHANFSDNYKRTHQGKTLVEVPEVYELVNIIFSLTSTGKTDPHIVRKKTSYHNDVIAHFKNYEQEPIVGILDSLLERGMNNWLKMDAYSFFFEGHQIKKSPTFNILSWGNDNTIEPYVDLLQAFANKSDFRKFYARHQALYQKQIQTYQDSIDTKKMTTWLEKHFPSTKYNSFKVIFSPLVNGNQSVCYFDNNDFKELQAHVNYPYKWEALERYPSEVGLLRRSDIVFTELNHGYINPEADKTVYQKRILAAMGNVSEWIGEPSIKYYDKYPLLCFKEYLNWGLLSLYFVDYAPPEFLPQLLYDIETKMVNGRGFTKFIEFNNFLIKLYQDRNDGKVLEDLYPQIIDWFATH